MRIEAGKWYLNREGNCVGPMTPTNGAMFSWLDGEGRRYFRDGRTGVGLTEGPLDLVKEWINPNAPVTSHPANSTARANTPPPIPPQYHNVDQSYGDLVRVLQEAHAQASRGEGKERHANGRAFDRQPIMEIGRMVGPGFVAGQGMKKAQEAMGMLDRHNEDAAVAELLGAINYLAACVMLVRERQV